MNSTVAAFLVGVLGAIAVFLYARNSSDNNAQILDLNEKIKENQTAEAAAKKTADDKVKEYTDALKAYDPNFYNDDGSGKPSA